MACLSPVKSLVMLNNRRLQQSARRNLKIFAQTAPGLIF
jgi:hypothetical protein